MSFINGTSTSAFLICTPTAAPVFTTVYETILEAACPTSQWMATYTITETCTGSPAEYTQPAIPAGFVVTTVTCDSCKPTSEIVITCPGAQPTGVLPTVYIEGNGVTATVAPTPAGAPAATAAPGGSGSGSGVGSGANAYANGTTSSPPVAVTAGAASLTRRGLAVVGMACVAVQFVLL
jgi:hypothetical protein